MPAPKHFYNKVSTAAQVEVFIFYTTVYPEQGVTAP